MSRVAFPNSCRGLFIALLFLLLFLGGSCLAAEKESTGAEVERLLRESIKAFQEDRTDEALTSADRALMLDSKHLGARLVRGRMLAQAGKPARSVLDFDEFIRLGGATQQPSVYQLRGVERFRLGDPGGSVDDFDEFLKRQPEQAAQHWQRGISCYYARRFEEGRRQFELHQTVNPNDVENAVWHFLCAARLSGLDAARRGFMPITGDRRVPMAEVHRLFAGRGTPEDVLAAASRGEVDAESRKERMFYAHLYLGLFHEAQDEPAKALAQIREAALTYPSQHYMGDVARVHLKLFEKGWSPGAKSGSTARPTDAKPSADR